MNNAVVEISNEREMLIWKRLEMVRELVGKKGTRQETGRRARPSSGEDVTDVTCMALRNGGHQVRGRLQLRRWSLLKDAGARWTDRVHR